MPTPHQRAPTRQDSKALLGRRFSANDISTSCYLVRLECRPREYTVAWGHSGPYPRSCSTDRQRPSRIALINAMGALGGFVGPYVGRSREGRPLAAVTRARFYFSRPQLLRAPSAGCDPTQSTDSALGLGICRDRRRLGPSPLEEGAATARAQRAAIARKLAAERACWCRTHITVADQCDVYCARLRGSARLGRRPSVRWGWRKWQFGNDDA